MASPPKGKRKLVSESDEQNVEKMSTEESQDTSNKLLDDLKNEFKCTICQGMIEDAQVANCGHSFCGKCISKWVEENNQCPTCQQKILTFFPNKILDEVIAARKEKILSTSGPKKTEALMQWESLAESAKLLDPFNMNRLMEALLETKSEKEKYMYNDIGTSLMKGFLNQIRENMQLKINILMDNLETIDKDIDELVMDEKDEKGEKDEKNGKIKVSTPPSKSSTGEPSVPLEPIPAADRQPTEKIEDQSIPVITDRWISMENNFDELQKYYLELKKKNVKKEKSSGESSGESSKSFYLEEFKDVLAKTTMYNNIRSLSTLYNVPDQSKPASMICSIDFDMDEEIFTTVGVTKEIKLFKYEDILNSDDELYKYPIHVFMGDSKVSSVNWSSFYKSTMATCDYVGSVTIWDASTAQKVINFREHSKRCWSVDFNKQDTNLLISTSDDCTAKIWSLNSQSSEHTMTFPANVCCAKFNPSSEWHFAVSSADKCVYYYDLRHLNEPMAISKDQDYPVSIIRFLNQDEIISATTHGKINTWNFKQKQLIRTFQGHFNDKYFIGLATNGDYIASGSENNSLYFYYKNFSKPAFAFSFDDGQMVHPLHIKATAHSRKHFVSSIYWMEDENILLAANSQGVVRVLKLF